MNLQRTESRIVYQHSKYVSGNESESSAAWDSILPGHGVIAIDAAYASSKQLPETTVLPGSDGKLVYVVEAYHVMHCVVRLHGFVRCCRQSLTSISQVNLRQHYLALQHNETWNWSHGHDLHCFDALRQYIMCNIDDTLLHTWGRRDAGLNQEKQCHDWDRLRQWTEDRSASYFDAEPGTGIDRLGNYHEGDGLPVGSLSGT